MKIQTAALMLSLAASASSFAPQRSATARQSVAVNLLKDDVEREAFDKALGRELDYKPGAAKTAFANKFGSLSGTKIRTVGEAFTDFTEKLGAPVNPLYKSLVSDIVGTTHLITVNARFEKDGIWALGIINSLDLLFNNYPEAGMNERIRTALFSCIGIDEDELNADAKSISDWAEGKSREDISAALRGEGDSPVAAIAKKAKDDEFWMYSKFFGLGLVKMMDIIGIEQNADEVYPIMEEWMGTSLGKPHFTACNDSDLYFRVKGKLDMMETMMKEIEIREKKRMAERLEQKAEVALAAAAREAEFNEVEAAEAEEKAKEKAQEKEEAAP